MQKLSQIVDEPIDNLLIQRIAGDDMDALRTLYNGIRGAVYGFALSIVKNTHDAEDVLQETILKVYASAGSYRPQGKPLAWIFTIARNLATDKVRQECRTTPTDDLSLCVDLDAVTDTDDRIWLQELLATLTAEEQQILILHAISGIKHREIAAVLDLPIGTVLSKYHRAVKQLKITVKEEMANEKL